MINLCRQPELRLKNKSMFPANKSHIASMNLRSSAEQQDCLRPAPSEEKPRSSHKYKKSLILQEATVQLVKRTS